MSTRIRLTPKLLASRTKVAVLEKGAFQLYRCEGCGQLWQASYAWNWGSRKYAYRVPPINLADWKREPYVSPSDLMEYGSVMADYLNTQDFKVSRKVCTVPRCRRKAIEVSVLCLKHHVKSLQSVGLLRADPKGRWFHPYIRAKCVPAL